MKIKNNSNSLNARQQLLGGNLTGIWDHNNFFIGDSPYPLPPLNYVTANLSNISSLIYGNSLKIIPHLSGYGSTYKEARLSFLGESSERYAFSIMPMTLRNDLIFDSYKNLCKKYGQESVLPLEYINVFDKTAPVEIISETDKINWIKMISLVNPEQTIYEPAGLVMFTDPIKKVKRYNVSAVSTGTASQESIEKSVENALIEYLQIDSYNLWWYGGHVGKKLDVDVKELFKRYFPNFSNSFLDDYDVQFTDISFDKHLWIVVCEIFGKLKRPCYSVGMQGAYSLDKALYRGLLEALTVMAYSINLGWMNSKLLRTAVDELNHMDNLDKNVAYYTIHDKPRLKENRVKLSISDEGKAESLQDLIFKNSNLLKWAGVTNITPHEFADMNLNVSRVIAPQMLPMCMPSYPPKLHPRYQHTGGIINNVEHPMA
ncbi:YcaO-like family protein [Lactobacillus sp. ESL0681]|uniref:YcaO-like family protein n=1 Tax=Lactobacillus sp. ESL0681 TaxID=2983211 RepID=UPI0023F9E70B|nr:YcaO-like family protein [Lactobacillus sp. ESL0681]WEV40753.1 YcaO-like family protein [Lactobacillus sp. ESL0681]